MCLCERCHDFMSFQQMCLNNVLDCTTVWTCKYSWNISILGLGHPLVMHVSVGLEPKTPLTDGEGEYREET